MQSRDKDKERLGYTADRLVEHIAGKPAASPDTREACRKLGVLLLRAVFPDVATTFRLSPRENRQRIEEVLRSMYRSDPEARSLIDTIARPEPSITLGKERGMVKPARSPVDLAYEDFVIAFEPPQDSIFPVRVNSPAGVRRGRFQMPACLAQPSNSGMTRDVCGLDPRACVAALGDDLVGDCLFEALFTKSVLGLFERNLGMMDRDERRGLRIKLQLDLGHPAVRPLHALPWERLYRSDYRELLALSRRTPVVRGLDVPPSVRPRVAGPLRVLLVTAMPGGQQNLDLERERLLIEDVTCGMANFTLARLEHASPEVLGRVLRNETPHVLHFMGHGGFDEVHGHGLILEDGKGGPCMLSGPVLADLLRKCGSLQLAVLTACRTGEAPLEEKQDPFTGVAPALVMAGLPAVLAMRSPISDGAAIAFSEAFYSGLAAGDPVESATTDGREAIRLTPASSAEWSIPVLFLR